MVITMAKLRMAHASTHGARKPPGPKEKKRKRERERERLNNGDNNGQATHGALKHAWRTQATWAKKFTSVGWCKLQSIYIVTSTFTGHFKMRTTSSVLRLWTFTQKTTLISSDIYFTENIYVQKIS